MDFLTVSGVREIGFGERVFWRDFPKLNKGGNDARELGIGDTGFTDEKRYGQENWSYRGCVENYC